METVVRSLVRTLTVFGGASVVAGGVVARGGAGQKALGQAFGQQTAAWGAVNLAIAAVSTLRAAPEPRRLRKVLLVNAGLDLGYIAAGAHIAFWTPSFRGRLTPEQARGHGLAVVLQGTVLLAIDAGYARCSRRATRREPAVRR